MGRDRHTKAATGLGAALHAALLTAFALAGDSPGAAHVLVCAVVLGLSFVERRARAGGGVSHVSSPALGIAWLALLGAALSASSEVWWAGALVLLGGAALRAWAVRTLGSHYGDGVAPTSPRLVRDGPYRLMRHPGELGNLLAAFGVALLLGSSLALAVASCVLVPLTAWRMLLEERELARAFAS